MDIAEIDRIASLALIELEDAEKERLAEAVDQMIAYFQLMQKIDVSGLEPTTHALLKDNRVRPDNNNPNNISDDLLDQAPELEDRLIVIPNVL